MITELKTKLTVALGAAAVSDDPATTAFMSNDVYRGGGTPALIVRPTNLESLQAAVRICAAARIAMVPRGGGASYTDAYLLSDGGHVLIDTGALDSIEVDVPNAVVTVGAGVTWAALKSRLDPLGLRTPFWGPFSGIAATVGGSISQNTVSHGTAAYGVSAQSVLSMDVVLASGEVLTTAPLGSAIRNYGPDLTGVFTGDCGALGIKASIRLPLIQARTAFATASFAFPTFAAYHAAVAAAQSERLDDSHFGIDLALSQGQIGKAEGVGARFGIARDILRAASGPLAGLRQLARMALAGDAAMRADAYMAHFIIDGIDEAEVAGRKRQLCNLFSAHGREIANTVPAFVRAMPFAPLTNVLGPNGERWVPISGVLLHDQAVPFHDALKALRDEHAAEMDRLGVWLGTMFSPVGSGGFLYEIAFYWPDARTAYHETVLDPDHVAGLPAYAADETARQYVDQLKRNIIDLYQAHGAAHFQIGRAYPYRSRLSPQTDALLVAIKTQVDPHNLMNPGVLGLGD